MALHAKKHQVETLEELEADATKSVPKHLNSDSATVVGKRIDGDSAYITVRSRNGKKVEIQYDLQTKQPVRFRELP
jgi:hypothetical protein